jgi:REP element-mobilizing transposase RayT
MARKLRYLPGKGYLVEVTCRVIHRRLLLLPSPQLTAIILGVLAHFQKYHGMKICGFVYLSNHCHLLLLPDSVEQLAAFMRDVNSKIAKEVGRLYRWREKLWGRRYTDVVVSHEPEAQVQRLRYLLEQGCKERLVASPKHWPGATSIKALLSGKPLEGLWIDRTEQYNAFDRNEPHGDALFTSVRRLELSPLPCWQDLEPHQHQARVRAFVREIEEAMEDVSVLGKAAICRQDPTQPPASDPPRTPAPRFHAIEAQVRRALECGYHLMRIAYRQACEDLRRGRRAEFPPGCFIPGRYLPLQV